RLDVVNDAAAESQLLHSPRCEFLRKIGQLARQGFRLAAQVQKNVAVPHSRVYGEQRIVLVREVPARHIRRTQPATTETIRPAVIRAENAAAETAGRRRAEPG